MGQNSSSLLCPVHTESIIDVNRPYAPQSDKVHNEDDSMDYDDTEQESTRGSRFSEFGDLTERIAQRMKKDEEPIIEVDGGDTVDNDPAEKDKDLPPRLRKKPPLEESENDDGVGSLRRIFSSRWSRGPRGRKPGIVNQDSRFEATITGGTNAQIIHNLVVYQNGDAPKPSRSEIKSAFSLIGGSLKTHYIQEESFHKQNVFQADHNIQHYYVDINIEELERGGEVVNEAAIQLEDILKKDIRIVGRKRLLIQGEAGFGKSTLCTKLAYDWAQEVQGGFVNKFDLVILYRLRNLGNKNLEEELITLCHNHYGGKDSDVRITISALHNRSEDILLLLDGYDEVPEERRFIVDELVGTKKTGRQSIFRSATMIVTTRPVNYPNHRKLYERLVRLNGISKKDIEKFIEKFFFEEPEKAKSLKDLLRLNHVKILHSLSPFLLDLVCHLHKHDLLNPATVTQYGLLNMVVTMMARRCKERENLTKTDEDLDVILNNLGEFFYNQPKSHKLVVPLSELTKAFDDQDLTFVTKCGLLNIRRKYNSSEEEDTLECLHKLFMEFLVTKNFCYKLEQFDTDQVKCDYIATLVNELTPVSVIAPAMDSTVILAPTIFPNTYFNWPLIVADSGNGSILSSSSFQMTDDNRSLVDQANRTPPLSIKFGSRMDYLKHTSVLMPHSLKEKESVLYILENIKLRPFTLNFYLYQENKTLINMEEEKITMEIQCIDHGKRLWDAIVFWSCNQHLNPELVELGARLSAQEAETGIQYRLNWMKASRLCGDLQSLWEWCYDIFDTILAPTSVDRGMYHQPLTPGQVIFDILPKLAFNKLGYWMGRIEVGRKNLSSEILSCNFEIDKIRINTIKGKYVGDEFCFREYAEAERKLTKLMNFNLTKKYPVYVSIQMHSCSRITRSKVPPRITDT